MEKNTEEIDDIKSCFAVVGRLTNNYAEIKVEKRDAVEECDATMML